MHQPKKGNQWYFSMKAHIGVDTGSGLVHTGVSSAATHQHRPHQALMNFTLAHVHETNNKSRLLVIFLLAVNLPT